MKWNTRQDMRQSDEKPSNQGVNSVCFDKNQKEFVTGFPRPSDWWHMRLGISSIKGIRATHKVQENGNFPLGKKQEVIHHGFSSTEQISATDKHQENGNRPRMMD